MSHVISHGKSRHYSFPIDVWGGRRSYIELDICLLNQKRSVKLPLSSRDNGELLAVVQMLHHTASEIDRLVKEHEERTRCQA